MKNKSINNKIHFKKAQGERFNNKACVLYLSEIDRESRGC